MSVITISTVGFKEAYPLSVTGKVFTIFFVIFGVGTTLYAVGAGAQFMLEGQLRNIFGRRKMSKRIQEIKDHYIICGYGKVARADTAEAEIKLLRAEANRAVSPHTLGGTRMALAALRPHLVDFMQVATSVEGVDIRIEELEVREGSSLSNTSLRECELR